MTISNQKVIEIMDNNSFIFIYKSKNGKWRVQYNHTKKEGFELKSMLVNLAEKYIEEDLK